MPGHDAVVVGAGPAGLAAAITLTRSGRDVVVIDKARFPRDKICGDGLTALALRYYEQLGLDPASVSPWMPVNDCHVRSPSGRTVAFPLPADDGLHAVVARRIDLDAAFVEAARAQGVEIRTETPCLDVTPTDHGVVVETPCGPVQARYLVAADGMWSPVRRALEPDRRRELGDWHASRQYVSGVSGRADGELWVWFDADLLPGYIWSFPLGDGRANIGYGVRRDQRRSGADLHRIWDGLLDRPHVRTVLGDGAVLDGPQRAWPIPARVTDVDLHQGRVLYVGDAAAATDPMTGEGIGQALLTGVEAAEAILEGPEGAVGERYEARVARHLFADHRMALVLGRLLSRPLSARAAVRIAGSTDWTRRHFARWLFEDYPRAVMATPRRWHRGIFTPPGAYR